MEKKLDQDHRLLAEKLEGFEVSNWSKDAVWEDISAQVFQPKKKRGVWWWYAVAAMIMLSGTFFLLPKENGEVAKADFSEKGSQQNTFKRTQPLEEQIAEQSVAEPEDQGTPEKPESTPVLAVNQKSQPVLKPETSQRELTETSVNKMSSTNESSDAVTTNKIREAGTSLALENATVERRMNTFRESAKVEEIEQTLALNTEPEAEMMEGKKVVLIIDDIEEGQTNQKDNFFKKIGKFNQTGEWEKNQKEKGIWARFIESTKPEQKAIQL